PAGTVVPVSAGTSTSLVAASAVLLVAPVSVPPPGRGLASGLLATVCVPAAPGVTVLLLALVTAVTALVVPVSPGTAALAGVPPTAVVVAGPEALTASVTLFARSETFPVSGSGAVAPLRSAVVSHVPSVNSQKRCHFSVAARSDPKMHVNSTVSVLLV